MNVVTGVMEVRVTFTQKLKSLILRSHQLSMFASFKHDHDLSLTLAEKLSVSLPDFKVYQPGHINNKMQHRGTSLYIQYSKLCVDLKTRTVIVLEQIVRTGTYSNASGSVSLAQWCCELNVNISMLICSQ